MLYKWVTYSDDRKNFSKWELLPIRKIKEWKETFKGKKTHVFSTVQSFDEHGETPQCPIVYADFDGENALQDARVMYIRAMGKLSAFPDIYFSGKKGFHLIVPYLINHAECSLIARSITMGLGNFGTLDKGRYGKRTMLREVGTRHPDTGMYKIKLNQEQLFKLTLPEIWGLAEIEPPQELSREYTYQNERLDAYIKEELKTRKKEQLSEMPILEKNILPCIEEILKSEIPQGEKHYTIFTLARYFRSRGYSEYDTVQLICSNATLKDYPEHVAQVVDSTYVADSSRFGCSDPTVYSDILKKHCSILCPFNKEKLICNMIMKK